METLKNANTPGQKNTEAPCLGASVPRCLGALGVALTRHIQGAT